MAANARNIVGLEDRRGPGVGNRRDKRLTERRRTAPLCVTECDARWYESESLRYHRCGRVWCRLTRQAESGAIAPQDTPTIPTHRAMYDLRNRVNSSALCASL